MASGASDNCSRIKSLNPVNIIARQKFEQYNLLPFLAILCYNIDMENKIITIEKKDVAPYVYFVCSIAQRGKMFGGLSGKSDYMGGIFDRWINIIPESVIFNKYYLPKIDENLSVVSDYYVYDPKKAGVAPDVFGVKVGEEIKPFVKFEEKWSGIEGAPQIEIKSFKKDQYMVSLRDQGYKDKYLVMVETDLRSDYLLPFFKEEAIDESVYNALWTDDKIFVKSDSNKALSTVKEVKNTNNSLGKLKPLKVCLAKDFMNDYANLCGAGKSPVCIIEMNEAKNAPKEIKRVPLSDYLVKNQNGLYRWKDNFLTGSKKQILLDISVENLEKIKKIELEKPSESSIRVAITGEKVKINGQELKKGKTYIIKFAQKFNRASKKDSEYFMHKSIVDMIPDKEEKMLSDIKNYIGL